MYHHGKIICAYQRNFKQRPNAHDKLYLLVRSGADAIFVSIFDSAFDEMGLLQLHTAGDWRMYAAHHSDNDGYRKE